MIIQEQNPRDPTIYVLGRDKAVKIFGLLLSLVEKDVLTEGVVQAAANLGTPHGEEAMKLLLKERGHEFTVTEEVVKAAVAKAGSPKVMELLLNERGHEFTVTNEIIEAAAANEAYAALGIFLILLGQRSQEITVTDVVVNAAAMNKKYGEEIVKLLFAGRTSVQLTQEGKMTMANEFGQLGTELLSNWKGQDVTTKGNLPG
ncbi:hypothetical protein G7054_g7077 [Neopestalotiopsis clavispora]|nr:hypothetical protein G7054_g7077 [Neopestalotiopsis clavispora]